jgi:hypothetical protein
MDKFFATMSAWEPLVFPTRTFLKEIVYWVSLFLCGAIYLYNIIDATTIDCNFWGEGLTSCFTRDLVRNREYALAALIMLLKHIGYTVDTFLLLRQKVARPLDFATNLNHMVFWIIIFLFGISFSSMTGCNGDNIFVVDCVSNFAVYTQESRWPMLWLAGVLKLSVDTLLLIFFHFVQKRRLSVAHGQAVSVILLDIQYFLVILWLNNKWEDPRRYIGENKRFLYDAKLLFIVTFITGLVGGLCFGLGCAILGLRELQGQTPSLKKNARRGIPLLLMASFWFLCIPYVFLFDGTAGQVKASFKLPLALLTLLMMALLSVYAVCNILAKKDLKFVAGDRAGQTRVVSEVAGAEAAEHSVVSQSQSYPG